MRNTNRKRIIKLSVAAAMFIGTGLDAGKIVSNAAYDSGVTQSDQAIVTANTQFGFGGWNLDNIAVKIVSITDYATALVGSWFDEATGEYSSAGGVGVVTPMVVGQSFESEISTGGEVRGLLHGKDWPVGEPAGIKVINNDLIAVANGDNANCIITSSYLDGFYLDNVGNERPVICSSGWQTHKRFKVNMQPTTVNVADFTATNGYGKPFELVFNLQAGDTTVEKYTVLQKINNYTGRVLDGYKIEVLDENGSKNPNLTLMLEKDLSDLANFSHGLWGPEEIVGGVTRFTDGFFDKVGVYYPVFLTDSQTIEWHGDLSGGNYMALFGSNWLHSGLAPDGIFYNDDNDVTTDAQLVFFWGTPPSDPDKSTPGWYTGNNVSTVNGITYQPWTEVTQGVVTALLVDPLYTQDKIEDTLNLGITYTVNIGDNTKIGSKFIIRITPHVDGESADLVYPTTPAPIVVSASGGSGGGFDALDNVSLIAMILGFLGIGAFIARRKLAKQKI